MDPEVSKIIEAMESDDPFRGRTWSCRHDRAAVLSDCHEKAQAIQKEYANECRPPPDYKVSNLILLKTQGLNDTGPGPPSKFIPRRDGPYRVASVLSSPTTYVLENV